MIIIVKMSIGPVNNNNQLISNNVLLKQNHFCKTILRDPLSRVW